MSVVEKAFRVGLVGVMAAREWLLRDGILNSAFKLEFFPPFSWFFQQKGKMICGPPCPCRTFFISRTVHCVFDS